MRFEPAEDIQKRVIAIIEKLELRHIDRDKIICMRSFGSKGRAYARIWSFPKIWQKALSLDTHYIIEVLSEKFDSLSREEQDKTLIHELLHVPKTFSGALVPHKCFGKKIDKRVVDKLFEELHNT